MNNIIIRTIEATDNIHIARIIRESLAEFGANRPGTVYDDVTTDHLYELFQSDASIYYIAELNNELVGGGGIFPSQGLPPATCELVKMYLMPKARGMGIGKKLLDMCISFATSHKYKSIYLETMPELKTALSIYENYEFEYLPGPLGNTGHYGCAVWMKKEI